MARLVYGDGDLDGQSLLIAKRRARRASTRGLRSSRARLIVGRALIAAGYLGTLWCYATMGDAWRMGINRAEKNELVNRGPYPFVRHPIYLFQIVMLAGSACCYSRRSYPSSFC